MPVARKDFVMRLGSSPLPSRRRLGLAPLARRLAVIVLVFVAIVACLLVLVNVEMAIMAGVRAYVEAESFWSKGQKDAVLHLRDYAVSHDGRDFARYRTAIDVPLGDHRARTELQKAQPDQALVRDGFLAGRNHPDDVTEMIKLFRRFGHVSFMRRAVVIWSEADRYLLKLDHAALSLQRRILAGDHDAASLAPIVSRIAELNRRMTPITAAFSATLGSGMRMLRQLFMVVIDGITLALLGVGVLFSWYVLRRVRGGEERYRQLIETASDAIVVTDVATGRILTPIGGPGSWSAFRSPPFMAAIRKSSCRPTSVSYTATISNAASPPAMRPQRGCTPCEPTDGSSRSR